MGTVALGLFGSAEAAKLCVVKRLLPEYRTRADFVRRFHDEAELARRLSHANLVETYRVGQIDGEPFIAQAFIEGHDLSEVTLRAEEKGESLSVALVVYIVSELARGLGYAHDFDDLNLVHRDINPPNVRLTYGGAVKLLDFGLATSLLKREKTEAGTRWGKAAYMAPEQMREGPIDGRADIYALGTLLWELLTGDRTRGYGDGLSAPEDFAATLARLSLQELPPASQRNPGVPAALDGVIAKAAAPSRDKRYPTAAEFRAALKQFLPAQFDAESELASLLNRLFKREREKEERDQLVEEGRHLLSTVAVAVAAPGTERPEDAIASRIVASPRKSSSAAPSLPAMEAPFTTTEPIPIGRKITPVVVLSVLAGTAIVATLAALWIKGPARDTGTPPIGAQLAPPPATMEPPLPSTKAPDEAAALNQTPVGGHAPPLTPARAPAQPHTTRPAIARRATPATAPGQAAEARPIELLDKARLAFARGALDDALREGELAVSAGAGADAQVIIGNVHLKRGNYRAAERAFAEALRLDPSDERAARRLDRARILLETTDQRP
jgi:serine/threonine protein kinase